ncbi:nucleotide-binding domain-containing protein [Delitschia confertaspora ATCC 74209]|uniref:Nucleotide-binding domain-containing protein n=1 Tax=Delitschia confertaspora ATCC 74209 TaxID=1513339 RepID=A0A9P4MQE8_9PLEO|nr:nucleotide-binding domain-containing protein [Delitschia confertaspora ATCC 74209]
MSTDPASSNSSRILIIGSGIFGASTAYHLSQTHLDPSLITIIDRTPFPPQHAASTDINKIVRADYNSRFYMNLAYEALEAWKRSPDLQGEDGEKFFHQNGWLVLSHTKGDMENANRIRQTLKERASDEMRVLDKSKEVLNNDLLRDAVWEEGDVSASYFNLDAGWADAGDAITKLIKIAVSRGVNYKCGDVETLILDDFGTRGARTKDGKTYEADKVVLATGAWTSHVLSPTEDQINLPEEERVETQLTAAAVCVAHYKLDESEYNRLKNAPVVCNGNLGEIIPPPRRSQLLKFTNAKTVTNTTTSSTGHRISAPPDQDQTLVPDKIKQETLTLMIRKTMPQLFKQPVHHWRLCWDAVTPQQDFLIAQHPHSRLRNLYLATGGSFHSWKFLPIIGKYVVNVLNGLSNGEEKDKRWAWKSAGGDGERTGRGAHEAVVPTRELRDLRDAEKSFQASVA